MKKVLCSGLLILFVFSSTLKAQDVLNATLLKADKSYIRRDYQTALLYYIKYLEKFPRDYYAERQTALCYNKLNKPDDAIDHWPLVIESSEATENDFLEYGRSLLINNRAPEARKIFLVLAHSKDKSLSDWAKVYLNPKDLFKDSAATKVIEVNGINSEFPEFAPVMFKEKLFYVSDKNTSIRVYHAVNAIQSQNIAGALKKDSVSMFPTIIYEKLQAMSISGAFSFSGDGASLCFCKVMSNKELKIKSKEPFFRYQLFTLTMSTMDNYLPEVKPFRYNSPLYDFMHPCISKDGKRLFFASNMKGSLGGKDIFMCELINGNWSAPKNVGAEVNGPGNEIYPHLSEEGLLYFASDHKPGLGGLDIFYAKPASQKNKLFEASKNAGANINSRFDDFGIYVLKGGKKGYLSSNRKNNSSDDIYYFVSKASN